MMLVRPGQLSRVFCALSGVATDWPEAIGSIGLVGAVVDDDHPTQLSKEDDAYLYGAMDVLHAQGVRFKRDLETRLYNRNYDPEQGDILLAKDLNVDAFVFCYLHWSLMRDLRAEGTARAQSPLASEPKAWERMMKASGVKFAVNVTADKIELPTAFLAQDPYIYARRERFQPPIQTQTKKMDIVVHRDWTPGVRLVVS